MIKKTYYPKDFVAAMLHQYRSRLTAELWPEEKKYCISIKLWGRTLNRPAMESSDDELSYDISHQYGISSDFGTEMSKLAFNELHSDIILVCEGKPYYCHKVSL